VSVWGFSRVAESGDPARIPLCVDLDGTLVRTDLLHEAALDLAKRNPLAFLKAPFWLRQGKAMLKHRVADLSQLDVSRLPYRSEVLELIKSARSQGRPVVLATAAAPQIAHAIAGHLQLFDDVVCSDESSNLSPHVKVRKLVERYGEKNFDYVGSSRADLPVWRAARHVIVVSNNDRLFRSAAQPDQAAHRIPRSGSSVLPLLKSLRPHQWLKNLLIFVPLLAAHHLGDFSSLLNAVLAAVAFSLAASSVYIVNDLSDLRDDRAHKSKHKRPFASGEAPVIAGVIVAPILLLVSIGIALLLPSLFLGTLLVYMFLTTAYSFRLKRQVVVDVILLAGLYTIRVIAGSAATQIFPSFWLLAFAMFIFFSLALVKRYTELLGSSDKPGALPGRGYLSEDMSVLMSLGTSSALMSVLILALYIDSPQVASNYAEPLWLWLLPPAMLYWTSRLWMKTQRGEVHDDPVVFAIRDRQSVAILLVFAPVLAAARVGWQPWL